MTITTYMSMTLPAPSITIGPEWAVDINSALTILDEHDHTVGKGNAVPTAGLNINADLSINSFSIEDIGSLNLKNLDGTITGGGKIYEVNGDLYFNDGSSNNIRITAGGSINVSSIGGIGGDYGTSGASCFYTDATKTYFFQDSTAAAAIINMGALTCSTINATDVIFQKINASGAITLTDLTASRMVATDASKKLVSVNTTGTGSVVLATSPTIASPTITTPTITSPTITTPTISSPSVSNLALSGTLSGTLAGIIASGSYTPTITPTSWSITPTINNILFQYIRIGNFVQVNGTFIVTVGAGTSFTGNLTISLPIATTGVQNSAGSITRSKTGVSTASETEPVTQNSNTAIRSFTTFTITESSTSYWSASFSYQLT